MISALEIRAACEIFNRWSAAHRGIGRFGRYLLRTVLTISVTLAAVTSPVSFSGNPWKVKYQLVTILNRGVHEGVAVFLLCTVAFFFSCGGPVARNLRRHSVAMMVFSTASAVGYFAIARNSIVFGSILLPAITIVTEIYWAIALGRRGEKVPRWQRLSREESFAVREWNRKIEEAASRFMPWWRVQDSAGQV